MANFSTPSLVLQTIRAGDTSNFRRSKNRVKITDSANGKPPLSEDDARKMGLNVNVNWGELASLLSHSRRQYYNAFLEGDRFFNVKLPLAPEEKCKVWESIISRRINKALKSSLEWFDIHCWRWTDVVLHGVATVVWQDRDNPFPRFIAREDLRVPTETYTSLTNMEWLAIRNQYTIGELVERVFGENVVHGWDRKAIGRILANYKNVNYDDALNAIDWETQPEKLAELVKQNLGYWTSDAVPTIPLYSFYFKDGDKWYLRVVPDTPSIRGGSEGQDKFLFESDEPEADSLDQLMHCQFGDLSFSTPFRFHSVRSLGFELMEPCFYTNLTRCRMLQHVHENFNPWVQILDPGDKARTAEIDFSGPVARIPTGVKIMGASERHQVDPNLVDMVMAQLKQLMQESSSTYTQQTDTGTRKEQTAFETGVKVQQVNAMLSGLLMVAFTREQFLDEEISRRFCLRDTTNDLARKFQQGCIADGVPREWLNVDRWDIEHVRPLGSGNPTLQQVQANQLMSVRPMLNPTAQQEVLHDYLTVYADARRAERWAPMDGKQHITDAQSQAHNDFGSLMWGSPVPIHTELNPQEQIETLLGKVSGVIVRIAQTNGQTDEAEIIGLQTVAQHITQLIQMLAQNPAEKQRVAQYGQMLSKLMNELKGFAQRMAESKQKAAQGNGNGDNGETSRKLMQAQIDARLRETKEAQAARHKDLAFQREQRRKDAEAFAEIERTREKSRASIFDQNPERQ